MRVLMTLLAVSILFVIIGCGSGQSSGMQGILGENAKATAEDSTGTNPITQSTSCHSSMSGTSSMMGSGMMSGGMMGSTGDSAMMNHDSSTCTSHHSQGEE